MTYQAYDINGYTFYTEEKDRNSEYQNSGVTMESFTGDVEERYYGRIEEIWELDYSGDKVPMFCVRWAKSVSPKIRRRIFHHHVYTRILQVCCYHERHREN